MNPRKIRVHLFCSVKGGVGRSTLAVICAKLLASLGRVPVVLDCDLTGTSLADGLNLRPPQVALEEDGAMDLVAPPSELPFHSAEMYRTLRRRREQMIFEEGDHSKWKDRPLPPPYINDAVHFAFMYLEPVRMDSLLWRMEPDDGVLYFPSSSAQEDVLQTAEWFYTDKPFEFAKALMMTMNAMAQQMPRITDIIIDLPPGIWGFPHEALVLAHSLMKDPFLKQTTLDTPELIYWEPNPFMVSSRDPNDFVPALEYIARHSDKLPMLKPLVNRANEGLEAVRAMARERLGPVLGASGLDEKMEAIEFSDALAHLFWRGDIRRESIPERVIKTLRLLEERI